VIRVKQGSAVTADAHTHVLVDEDEIDGAALVS
jgi:hypothetical protein